MAPRRPPVVHDDPDMMLPPEPGDRIGHDPNTGESLADPRVSETPLFANARPDFMIQVSSHNPDTNRWQNEGTIAGMATEAELVRKWPRPGAFKLQAVDVHGRAVGEARIVDISPSHATLRQILAQAGNGVVGVAGVAVPQQDAALLALREMIQAERDLRERERIDRMAADREAEERMRQREIQAQAALAEAAEKQSAAAALLYERNSDHANRIIEQQRAAGEMALNATTTSMGQILMMQQQLAEAQANRSQALAEQQLAAMRLASDERVKQAEIAAARASQEHEERMAREREYAEQRRREERDRMEAEAERQRNAHKLMHDLMRERDKERSERADALEDLRNKQNPLGALAELVTTATTVGAALGVDLKELVGGLGGAAKMSGWQELAKTGLETLKEVAAAARAAQAEEDEPDEPDEPMVTIQLANGATVQVPASQVQPPQQRPPQGQLPDYGPQGQPQPQPQYAPAGAPAGGYGMLGASAAPGWAGAGGGAGGGAEQQWAGNPPAHQMPGQPPPGQPPPNAPQPPPLPPPPPGVSPDRAIRGACVELVNVFETRPESDWMGAVAATAQLHGLAFVEYLRQNTITKALIDAGASMDLAKRVVTQIDASGMVPNDIPR